MGVLVEDEVGTSSEPATTNSTDVWPLPRVCPFVRINATSRRKAFATVFAHKRPLPCMGKCVAFEERRAVKLFITIFALVHLPLTAGLFRRLSVGCVV